MRIAIVGTGYVGLVAGTCLAETGNDVLCVDSDVAKIEELRAGRVPIHEPGLADLLRRNVSEERLRFDTDLARAVVESEVVFVAVGTPSAADGGADLSCVFDVAEVIARAMTHYTVIVLKSTVPTGTACRVRQLMARHACAEFDVVSNPEFLKEGSAVEDFFYPDRIIVGSDSERARTVMSHLYAPYLRTDRRILFMDCTSAELTKYASNALLAVRISFMNEIAAIAALVEADVDAVRKGMGADRRIGHRFLFPGVGWGGSCFPKDVRALIATSESIGLEPELFRAAHRINQRQKRLLVDMAREHFARFGGLHGKRLAIWGLAFKPKTDDVRDSPALTIAEALLAEGARVAAYDPVAMAGARRLLGDRIEYATSPYSAAHAADALLLVTEWNQFRNPDFDRLRSAMRAPVVFDGRNIYDPSWLRQRGFTYYGVGRR